MFVANFGNNTIGEYTLSGSTVNASLISGLNHATAIAVVVPASGPAIVSIRLSGTNLVINGTNGQSGSAYVTLMSTNLALPRNQWKPVATNNLNATGNFSITVTNAVDAKALRQFYLLQIN